MNFHDLDLNLLLVFDSIYRERSISKAANALGLSQPAISNALRRLRDFTGDVLFYRSGSQMMPTRVANALALPIGEALATVRNSLLVVRGFDPAISNRRFRLAINDMVRTMLLPTLANVVNEEAPNVVLEVTEITQDAPSIQAAVRAGDLDMCSIPTLAVEDDMDFETFIEEELVLIVRSNHPLLGAPVTKQVLSDQRHVVPNSAQPMRLLVDEAFRKFGAERQVACVVPRTSDVPAVVEVSNLIGAVGRSFVRNVMRDHAISILETPFPMPRVEGALIWAKASSEDQGVQWLRERMLRILKTGLSLNK